ncbi:PAS domain S-box protein [Chloroflexota bacterium]
MKDSEKTREQLVSDLVDLRQHVAEIETLNIELKQELEKLRSSEERYRLISENTSDVVALITFNINPVFVYVSPSIKAYGYKPEDLIGTRCFDIVHLDYKKQLLSLLKKYLTYKTKGLLTGMEAPISETIEFRAKDKSGNWYYLQGTTDLVENQILGIFRDITEIKKSEEIILNGYKRYKDLADFLPQSVFETDAIGNVTFVNDIALERSGYNPEDINKGLNGVQLVIPEERDGFLEHMKKVISGEIVDSIDVTSLNKDGSTYPSAIFATPILDNGKPIGSRGFVIDITRRKQEEEALQQSEERYRVLFEDPTLANVFFDNKGIVTLVNTTAAQVIGKPVKDIIDKHIKSVYPAQSVDIYLGRITQALETGKTAEYTDFIKSTEKWFITRVVPTLNASGNTIGVQTSTKDITDSKQAEQNAQELYQKEIALRQELEAEIEKRIQFTRMLVHELKTPLTPMIASSDLLMEEIPDGILFQLARSINQGALTLEKRINVLLDTAKGELGVLELVRTETDLLDLLHRVAEDTTPLAYSRNQVLSVELPVSLPKVLVDGERLHQVVVNLLDNSFKFTSRGGKITLRAKKKGDAIIVEVEDTGSGIPLYQRKHLFEAFYHVKGQNEHGRGLGLGLALSKLLVELHGGKIWVESQEGKGSKFGFSVPLCSSAS